MNEGELANAIDSCMQFDDAALLQQVHEYECLERRDIAEMCADETDPAKSNFSDEDLRMSIIPKIRSLAYLLQTEPDMSVDLFANTALGYIDEVALFHGGGRGGEITRLPLFMLFDYHCY